MTRPIISPDRIYHVVSRGVDGRNIFLDKEDYFRFIHNLFEFNNKNLLPSNTYNFGRANSSGLRNPNIGEGKRKPRTLLVEILVFCLMKNHYHLLLRPFSERGLPFFMKRLNTGYANYFNNKYERKGTLFQGRYKLIAVTNDPHFVHLPYYIHANPLDLIMPSWREKEIKNYKKAMEFLENYRWSSYPDYIGKKNFPSVTQREFLTEFLGGPERYKKDTVKWLKEMNIEKVGDFVLE